MDVWDTLPQVSRRPNRSDHRQHTCPSFSSTLLDAIYRSIDEPNAADQIFPPDTTMRMKNHVNPFEKHDDAVRFHRSRKVAAGEPVMVRRKSTTGSDTRRPGPEPVFPNSNSSSASSDSSGFSSSESDSFYKPKPIRTSLQEKNSRANAENTNHHSAAQKQSKREGGFVRTKSKALKIYSDLKKVKQPISPGGRLASFLNSLFTAGNAKKAKMIYDERKTKTEQTPSSTCSSASSFSRSCLSKTPSSRGKTNDTKRSVTFDPVSVIVDEDCKPCGHKRLLESQRNHSDKELEFRILEENRRVVEAAKELLKSYHKKKLEYEDGDKEVSSDDDDDDGDDDAASYASSDLFELDNLSAIGIERYREELPVYETTHLDTNRAIASGLIV